jgi:hypothetical protein
MGKIKFEGNPPYALPMVQNVTARADMSAPPGRVVRGVQRALLANPGRELTTRELWEWTHPREVRCGLTNAFSKKVGSHACAVALHAMYYNSFAFIRHSRLRQQWRSTLLIFGK